MTTKQFTVAQLADLGVPPADPREIEFSEILLADERLSTLKYSENRRCVFRDDDGTTWAVEYEAQLDAGDYETGPPPDNHGWYGTSVEAVQVEERAVVVRRWEPVTDEPASERRHLGALDSLTEIWEEAGARPSIARTSAAAWLIEHADEVAELYDEYLNSGSPDQGGA